MPLQIVNGLLYEPTMFDSVHRHTLYISDCGEPEASKGTIVLSPATVAGSQALYSCDTGYFQLKGDSSRTCLNEGTWSGSSPHCVVIGE